MDVVGAGLVSAKAPDEDDGPILVATDGHPHADTALIAAAFMAGRTGREVRIFSVVEPDPERCGSHKKTAQAPTDLHTSEAVAGCCTQEELQMRRTAVETQVALTVGEAAEWPITVHSGPLDQTTNDIIHDCQAQLVVIGQCGQRYDDAPPHACHATQILTQCVTPIYIAAPTLRSIARSVVVAMDFSAASIRAAHVISGLGATDAILYLVHVIPHSYHSAQELDERRHQLQYVERSLRASSYLRVDPILLLGAAAPEILAFADGIHADVIACGSSSTSAFPNTHPCNPSLGRVTREIIRQAPCSLLITPNVSDN